ncbi:hypothetical protein Pfo_024813 [Paulownia fortunei]|nr:hypothetical protein Pfo_024813 [Paulownia fortunei]
MLKHRIVKGLMQFDWILARIFGSRGAFLGDLRSVSCKSAEIAVNSTVSKIQRTLFLLILSDFERTKKVKISLQNIVDSTGRELRFVGNAMRFLPLIFQIHLLEAPYFEVVEGNFGAIIISALHLA